MNNELRRKSLKLVAAGIPAVWAKPVIHSVVLPAHANTSDAVLTCFQSDDDGGQVVIPEGSNWSSPFFVHYATNPPLPNAPITWVGLCDGVEAFAVQNSTLDENGEFLISVTGFDNFCNSENPTPGTVIGHRLTLSNSNSATCTIVFSP